MEATVKDAASVSKKEDNSFAKLKSTIIIMEQRDSEAREVARAEERKSGG